jgi:hypothetical protein
MNFNKNKEKTGGRKRGSKNKSTLIFENLLIENRAELLSKAIELAKEGNERILLKLLDKIVPTLNSMDLQQNDQRSNVFEVRLIKTRDDDRTPNN